MWVSRQHAVYIPPPQEADGETEAPRVGDLLRVPSTVSCGTPTASVWDTPHTVSWCWATFSDLYSEGLTALNVAGRGPSPGPESVSPVKLKTQAPGQRAASHSLSPGGPRRSTCSHILPICRDYGTGDVEALLPQEIRRGSCEPLDTASRQSVVPSTCAPA